MSNFKPKIYADTDSIKLRETNDIFRQYCMRDTLNTKQVLNLMYGIKGDKTMNREYISVIVDKEPTVIFKRNIIAVSKNGSNTMITCVGDVVFFTKEDYASVVKKIIGKGV